jgi:hypothetical protein
MEGEACPAQWSRASPEDLANKTRITIVAHTGLSARAGRVSVRTATSSSRTRVNLHFIGFDETIGDFLLLLRSICYGQGMAEREHIVNAVEAALMPFAPGLSDALSILISRHLEVATKGGQG